MSDCLHGIDEANCGQCHVPLDQRSAPVRQLTLADVRWIREAVTKEARSHPSLDPADLLKSLEERFAELLRPSPRGFGVRKVDDLRRILTARKVEAPLEELVILLAVQRTRPAGQFGVTNQGEVFTSESFGYTQEMDRLYVSGLSPLLYNLGLIYWVHRDFRGGRFLVSPNLEVSEADAPHLLVAQLVQS